MYLRHTIRKKDGKVHRYWRLVRSVRVGRRVIQQTVAQLGELDERGRIEARALARRLIGAPEQVQLFKGSGHESALYAPLVRTNRQRVLGSARFMAISHSRGRRKARFSQFFSLVAASRTSSATASRQRCGRLRRAGRFGAGRFTLLRVASARR